MEYPGSIITYPIRRAILITFLAAFFVITPIIIMYTEGYRYDWQNWQRGLFKETGAISIDILPKNAVVYLNNTKLNSKMPIRLKNVAPQKYDIKITAAGYFDWTKEIEVKSKQTIYIKEIVMLQKNEPTLAVEGNINQLSISPNERRIIYTLNNGRAMEIWIRNLQNSTNEKISDWPKVENIKVAWSENNNYFALSNETTPYNKVLIINADNISKQTDLVKKIKYSIDKYSWKESIEPELFFGTNLKILSYLPSSDRVLTLGKNTFIDWYMENGQLWTLQISTSTDRYSIVRDTLGFSSVFKTLEEAAETDNNKNIKILVAKNNNVLLKKDGSSEMVLVTNNKTYNIAGDKFIISKYNNWWLMWTPWELWSYTEGEEPTLLNRSGEQLQDVIPLDEYNTLGLCWAEKTTVLFPYYYVSHDMLNYPVNSTVADSDGRVLYYAGVVNGKNGLWKLNY